ncbi:helix-turn-helix transcriptional regulator [Micromonospora sp. NPDC050397]|uniref:helix-turn-helix transcriptional regulator n=1 Tax=Micromonospora sp. NPDC050397 TaxID=3364279 RepID=UPI00384CFB87
MSERTVQRSELHTRNHDAVAEAINRIGAHRARISVHDPGAAEFRVRSVTCDGFGADLVRLNGVTYSGTVAASGNAVGLLVLAGGGRASAAGADVAMARNDGMLYPVGAPVDMSYRDLVVATVRVPGAEVAELAEEVTGLPGANLRFTSLTPVSAPMRRYWCDTVGYLCRQLTAPGVERLTLVVDQLRRLAVMSLLSVFPNTAMTAARLPRTGHVTPAPVRRAIGHIEAHADLPVTVTEIATAAGVSPRALQEAFRRQLDTTPMGYLRRVRLERAHRDLQDAEATTGATVASVARRWGFTNPGRFSVDYRKAYGQHPSRTLRS